MTRKMNCESELRRILGDTDWSPIRVIASSLHSNNYYLAIIDTVGERMFTIPIATDL